MGTGNDGCLGGAAAVVCRLVAAARRSDADVGDGRRDGGSHGRGRVDVWGDGALLGGGPSGGSHRRVCGHVDSPAGSPLRGAHVVVGTAGVRLVPPD